MTNAERPTDNEREMALFELEKQYKPVVHYLDPNWYSWENYVRIVHNLDMQSSPGYPYCNQAPTIGAWFKFDGISVDSLRLKQLWYDVKLVFDDRYDTILKVFIKLEPHKRTKILKDRWRLIMCSPLPVQVAWHMCFDQLNDLEIDKSYFIPSQHGMLIPGGAWKQYYNLWKTLDLTAGLDKEAWDWTAPFWAIMDSLELRFRLCRGPKDLIDDWKQKSTLLYRHMFEDPKILLSSGELFQQTIPGIMKSGCVNTISDNGHCQQECHAISAYRQGLPLEPFPRSGGDDTLHKYEHVVDLSVYKSFGIFVKSVSETTEFLGHSFDERGMLPLYLSKHIFKSLYIKPEDIETYLDAMARMYCHDEDLFEFWQTIALKKGVVLPLSRKGYVHWKDFSE